MLKLFGQKKGKEDDSCSLNKWRKGVIRKKNGEALEVGRSTSSCTRMSMAHKLCTNAFSSPYRKGIALASGRESTYRATV